MNESVASDPTLNFVEALIFYNNMNKKHFVEKYSAKFGNHLIYDNLPESFNHRNELLMIGCKIHGFFNQTADAHRQSLKGCPKCGNETRCQGMYQSEFDKKIDEKFPDRDWKIITPYINMHQQIDISTKYGICSITAQTLLNSKDITIKSAINKTEYFINRFNDLFGDIFDFSKFVYNNSRTHSIVICKQHGEFKIKPNNLMSGHGCPECGNIKISEKLKSTIEEFIIKANKIHNNFYNYDNSVYGKSNKSKIDIVCPLHGNFSQTISDHLSGYGCKECGKIIISEAVSKIPIHLRKMTQKIRNLISSSYRRKTYNKNSSSAEILGCNWEEFKEHLENNPYGYTIDCSDLDLDHIIPISSALTENDLYKLNKYHNFQLLPRVYNQYIKRTKEFNREHFEQWLIDTGYSSC